MLERISNDNMGKEKSSKAGVVLIAIIAFILGIILGHYANNITETKERYQYEVGENILLNSGFENEFEGDPTYWYKAIITKENLTVSWDNEEFYSGSRSVSINNTHIYEETTSNNWAQTINIVPIDRYLELTGWIKTIDAESVVMVIQCWDDNSNLVGFGTTQSIDNITGTNVWAQYKASVRVPTDTEFIIVRLALTGTGQVWFDDVTLLVK